MKLSLFRRQLVITVVLTLAFLFLGFLATALFREFERGKFEASPLADFAKLIDEIALRQGISAEDAVAIINSAFQGSRFPFDFSLVDRAQVAKQAGGDRLPVQPYQVKIKERQSFGAPSVSYVALKSSSDKILVVGFRHGPPPDDGKMGPPPPMGPGGPQGPGGPMGPDGQFRPPPPHGPGGPGVARGYKGLFGPVGSRAYWVSLLSLVLSVVLASAVSLFILFYRMREKADLVRRVIGDMKKGQLNSRLPITRMDEVGHLMQEFNRMADEIERLIGQLRTTEQSRMALLQELAHDLRTPVASLKNLLETLSLRKQALTEELRDELTALSLKEIEYFERLIEDLLFLAQVTEPKYNAAKSDVEIVALLDDELEAVATRYESMGRAMKVERDYSNPSVSISGDPHLLRRLLRNALENAFSFARERVSVRLKVNGERLSIFVTDDGPGLSPEALAGFGEKRVTRAITQEKSGRLSVGLGSVIMKAVVQVHGGIMKIHNAKAADGQVTGAELDIELKRAG